MKKTSFFYQTKKKISSPPGTSAPEKCPRKRLFLFAASNIGGVRVFPVKTRGSCLAGNNLISPAESKKYWLIFPIGLFAATAGAFLNIAEG